MLASGAEHPCRIVAMSTGEMLFSTPVRPRLGEKVIVYIAELGRFEGGVSRHEGEGFAIGLKLTEMKHRKLAEQLVWFANRDVLDLPENRRHKRIVPMLQWTIVRLSNGKEKTAKINDISLSGVSVEVNARPLVGAASWSDRRPRRSFASSTAVSSRSSRCLSRRASSTRG